MAKAMEKSVPVEQLGDLDSQGLLDQIIDTGIRPRDDAGRERARDLVQTLVDQLLTPGMVVARGVGQTINSRIAEIDGFTSGPYGVPGTVTGALSQILPLLSQLAAVTALAEKLYVVPFVRPANTLLAV